jgi:GH25 family lysozyme M1 (1,4-beta-N-acetylmuramidase)
MDAAVSDAPVCIDISHYQGYPDFARVYAVGVLGVIHKATEGTSYIDPCRAANLAAAKAAGLAIATYFWLKPGNARAQAEFYLSVVQPVPGERVIIDYEEQGVTLDMLHEAVQSLLDYGAGLKITVYSGSVIKEQLGDRCDAFLAGNTDLWLAQWTTGDLSWPAGTWPRWSLHQYSENGAVPGIEGDVDLDEYNGSAADFLAWISPAGTPPKPGISVGIALTVPDHVTVTVSINGVPQ